MSSIRQTHRLRRCFLRPSRRNGSRALTLAQHQPAAQWVAGLAYTAIADSDKPRHEVYIFTDLARSAWDLSHSVEGLEKAAKDKTGMKTYVLRLTPKDARDVAVVEARPTADIVTEGEPVGFRARLRALGPAVSLVAKLYLDNVPKEEKQVTIPANGEIEVPFMPQKVDATSPVHQGKVVLSGVVDDLDFDDVRYFTFKVQPATNVLVVADDLIDAEYIANAIAPDPRTLPPGTARPFRAEKIQTGVRFSGQGRRAQQELPGRLSQQRQRPPAQRAGMDPPERIRARWRRARDRHGASQRRRPARRRLSGSDRRRDLARDAGQDRHPQAVDDVRPGRRLHASAFQ